MTNVLNGPADADHFRQSVGRYNERWYIDSLPGCEIADAAPEWQAPSWSTVKGAAGKDWSFVANKRNAGASADELHRIADLDPTQRAQAFNAINKAGLEQAAGRGTIVHLWAEDLLWGREPRKITDLDLMSMKLPKAALDEALMYRPALLDFFAAYQPELVAAEYVALCRGLNGPGYGCTPDALVRVEGDIAGIDWKSRTIDSKHSAYPEEGAQIAAGVRADYMIVDDGNGGAKRALLPKVDVGLVVSIKPDGARVYPIDIDGAWKHVQAMHAFWVARQDERSFISRVRPPKTAAPSAPEVEQPSTVTDERTAAASVAVDTIDRVKARVATLLDDGHKEHVVKRWPFRADGTPVPTFKQGGHTDDDVPLLLAMVRAVEADVGASFHEDDAPAPNPRPDVEITAENPRPLDEGGEVDAATREALARSYGRIKGDGLAAIKRIANEANAGGRSISVQLHPTVRRWSIARALIAWADTSGDPDVLFEHVAAIVPDTSNPDATLGALVGGLTIEEATRLHDTFGQSAAA